MVEPITTAVMAMKVCSAAVKNVSKLIEDGREIHDCQKSIVAFFSAKSDIERIKKEEVDDPPLWKKIAGDDTAKAVEVVMARKKSIALMGDLHRMLKMAYGPDIWKEVIEEQRKIEKDRERRFFKRKRIIRLWLEGFLVTLATVIFFGLVGLFIWIFVHKKA